MIVTHGWPGSIIEQMKIIEPLTNPTAHGGSAADAFHLVIPSLPGYGFSGKPTAPGWNPVRIAQAWATLMQRLGYTRYVAQGGDWGNAVSELMALQQPPGLLGIHTNMAATVPADVSKALPAGGPPPAGLSADEKQRVGPARRFLQERSGLRPGDDQPAADALRHRGFAGRPRGLDARPRHPQLPDDRPRLRREDGRADARRHARQRHALLADEHGGLLGAPLLGHRAICRRRLLRREGRQDPGRRERLPRRDLSGAEELGGAGLPQADPLQQARQGRPFRGLGAAGAVHGGDAGGVHGRCADGRRTNAQAWRLAHVRLGTLRTANGGERQTSVVPAR